MYLSNKHYKAIYDNLWDYFQVLKNDGVIAKHSFNDYDCKHLAKSIVNDIDKIDMDEHAVYSKQYLGELEAGQEFNESF